MVEPPNKGGHSRVRELHSTERTASTETQPLLTVRKTRPVYADVHKWAASATVSTCGSQSRATRQAL